MLMPPMRVRVADIRRTGVLVFGEGFGATDGEDSAGEVFESGGGSGSFDEQL
jgi:hypothetical protein